MLNLRYNNYMTYTSTASGARLTPKAPKIDGKTIVSSGGRWIVGDGGGSGGITNWSDANGQNLGPAIYRQMLNNGTLTLGTSASYGTIDFTAAIPRIAFPIGSPGVITAANGVTIDGTLYVDTPTNTSNQYQAANKTYVDGSIASALTGIYRLIGQIDCSDNPLYPEALPGYSYTVSVAGKIGGNDGRNVDVGDTVICVIATAGGTQAEVGGDYVIMTSHNGLLAAANNLSDLTSPSTARINLGLGSLATMTTSGSANSGTVLHGDGTWRLSTLTAPEVSVSGSSYTLTAADDGRDLIVRSNCVIYPPALGVRCKCTIIQIGTATVTIGTTAGRTYKQCGNLTTLAGDAAAVMINALGSSAEVIVYGVLR